MPSSSFFCRTGVSGAWHAAGLFVKVCSIFIIAVCDRVCCSICARIIASNASIFGLRKKQNFSGVNKFQNFSMAASAVKAAKRKREPPAASERGSSVWCKLREAQRKCGCSTNTLKAVLQAVKPFCHPGIVKNDEQLVCTTNAVVLQLHGCVGCDDFVFEPTNKMIRCPKCQHPRFNQQKKPNEVRALFIIIIYYYYNFFDCLLIFWCVVVLCCAGVLVLPSEGPAGNTSAERQIPAFIDA